MRERAVRSGWIPQRSWIVAGAIGATFVGIRDNLLILVCLLAGRVAPFNLISTSSSLFFRAYRHFAYFTWFLFATHNSQFNINFFSRLQSSAKLCQVDLVCCQFNLQQYEFTEFRIVDIYGVPLKRNFQLCHEVGARRSPSLSWNYLNFSASHTRHERAVSSILAGGRGLQPASSITFN